MALKSFNLDLTNLDRLQVLIHGPYGSGKTHLQGDFLRWCKQKGEVRFINVVGEDGMSSIAKHGLGSAGWQVETVEDFDEALAEAVKLKLAGLAVDSLSALYQRTLYHFLGEVRYPDPKKDGERAKMLWGQISMSMRDRVTRARVGAPYVLWVSPYDRSEDTTGGGKGITPDLPGKLAYGCAGWYDFVGYLEAQTVSPTRVNRTVDFSPQSGVLTRQRIPTPITQKIVIPENTGGWQAIFTAMTTALAKETK